MERSLRIAGRFSKEERSRADSYISSTFYYGDLELYRDGRGLHAEIEQVASRPWGISVVKSASHYSWRRSWTHIRRDCADFCVVRLQKQGQTNITHQSRTVRLSAGDLMLTRSSVPICVEVSPENTHLPNEMIILLIPTAICRQNLNVDEVIGRALPKSSQHHRIVVDLLRMLAESGGALDEEAADHIGRALVKELAALAGDLNTGAAPPSSLPEARLADIRDKIRTHFANPGISLEMIARKCGISPRYVTYVMAKFDTSFYREVKMARLMAARKMLRESTGGNIPISQISFCVGFKSPSHFSYLFKREFGHSPSDERFL